ncbi:hypothetical protein MRB53_039738 [Persea americana]|nr:hypothetical protein MRB53_039738 [Persea americana]
MYAIKSMALALALRLQEPRGESADEPPEPAIAVTPRPAGKGKSSLRPVSSSMLGKGPRKREESSHDRTDDSTTSPSPKRSRRAEARLAQKTARESDAAGETLLPESRPTTPPLPLRPRVSKSRPMKSSAVVITTTPIPTLIPQGPSGTWTCEMDGCSHVVYGADGSHGRALAEEHYKMHAIESQSVLDLVYKEERPYLPVSNLIRRIKEIAAGPEAQNLLEQSSGGDVEAGVKRRF